MATVQEALPGVAEALRVHPVAELFPMMSDEELDDLAADIRDNGLVHPIVVDGEGTLIDGRNRLEACRRGGVEPEWTTFDGDDPVAFILSSNVNRRHLSKGQAAMAVALARKETLQGTTRQLATTIGTSHQRVHQATIVVAHASELADAVLAGATSLDDAYRTATDRKRAAESTAVAMAGLLIDAPDLADLVKEERMSLPEALAAARERKERDRSRRESTTRLVMQAVVAFDPGEWSGSERAARLAADLSSNPLPDGSRLTAERLRSCAAVAEALADLIAQREKGA